ncbi:unnamed protein product [Mytilus edulis]|uniref:Receptor ligand binding region domain-containing protein n=1 Tax=Mytilus edulis TaxID=6550 RepID=A0A8S3UR49_MYTED|nr:unnamed protein product [Mytilus edulis]
MAFTMEKFALFYVRIFNFYHWQNIVLIYEEKQPLLNLLAKSLYDVFLRVNITTTSLPFRERNFEPLLQEGSKHSRVFATISTDDDFWKLILAAQSLGMTNGEYVHLYIRFYEVEHTGLRSWERNDEFDEVARSAYDSVLVLQPSRPESKRFTQFVKDVKVKAFNEYNYTMHNKEVNIFTTAFYDSISVYAQIINETLTDGGDIRNGQNISRRMKNRVFHDVIRQIKTKCDKPFRPSLPAMSDDVPKMIDLMQACWDESLFKRPTISASHNILDALLRRMEQNANNLKELVGQRTEAFLEE